MEYNPQDIATREDLPQSTTSVSMPPSNPSSWPYMSYLEAVLISVALLVLQVILGILAGILVALIGIALGYMPDKNPLLINPAVFMVANIWAVFPLLVWGWWRSGQRVRDALGLNAIPWAVILAILPLGVGAALLMSELDNIIRWAVPQLPTLFTDLFEQLFSQPILGFLVVVVMAPITEEPLFRGVVLRGLLRRHGPWASCVVSALLFGLIHINPPQVIAASLLGLLLAGVHLRTDSLWPCIWLHAVVNAVPMAAFGLVPGEIEGLTSAPEAGAFQPLWLDALAIALFALGVLVFFLVTRAAPEGQAAVMAEREEGD